MPDEHIEDSGDEVMLEIPKDSESEEEVEEAPANVQDGESSKHVSTLIESTFVVDDKPMIPDKIVRTRKQKI